MKIYLIIALFMFVHPGLYEWKKLENSEYEIKYPDGWVSDESGVSGTRSYFLAPLFKGSRLETTLT